MRVSLISIPTKLASPLKKLAGQTAVYGLSSIIGRFLNYLLTPIYTSREMGFDLDQYGIITEMYAYVAFLVVLLTYGMETAFFRYFKEADKNPNAVYSTALWSLLGTSFAFIIGVSLFSQQIADALGYPNHREFISWFGIIVALDALITIPLAKLRAENRALRFVSINFSFILINILLNVFILMYCKPLYHQGHHNWLIDTFYNPEIGVGYVFIINLLASVSRFVLTIPDMLKARLQFDRKLWRQMLLYGGPLLIAGLAGIVNETLDRALLKWMLIGKLGETETMAQLGIYGACYKLSIIITLCIQAYRYAAEPFFFDQKNTSNAQATYARMLHLFFAFVMFVFLGVTLFIDIFKWFIPNEAYWVGLDIVPVLLLANVFLGVYYNLSAWFKLTDKTLYGSYIAIGGALLTVALNVILIPIVGFRGSAWATLACYFSMAAISYVLGQRHYPVPYNLMKLGGYFALAIGLFFANGYLAASDTLTWVARSLMIVLFAGVISYTEFIYPKQHVAHRDRQ
ncbi:MAG: polysaccharide biosynthesis C-terminal domain-containing protein [Flavobacteriales bacterium]